MKQKFNMDDRHLRENPHSVPEGYFSSLQDAISDKISAEKQKPSFWRVARPQLALAASFAVIFIIAYATINLFSPGEKQDIFSSIESDQLDGLYVKTSFVDFYDSSTDTLYTEDEEEIDPEEIVEYLSSNTGIIYIASLD
ncbi:MAG: hypothetical protein PHV46_08115 [Bacteroidales bacterium]|jgi:hypothetical protein|nr:hypothetical protein [Bacteroidales bacterium]MDD4058507.1 hypothetical protein [Bacteroidales bacterium]